MFYVKTLSIFVSVNICIYQYLHHLQALKGTETVFLLLEKQLCHETLCNFSNMFLV